MIMILLELPEIGRQHDNLTTSKLPDSLNTFSISASSEVNPENADTVVLLSKEVFRPLKPNIYTYIAHVHYTF